MKQPKRIYEVFDSPRRRFTVEDGYIYIDTEKGKRPSSLSELQFIAHSTFGAEYEIERQRAAIKTEKLEADKQLRLAEAKRLLIGTGYHVVKTNNFPDEDEL
jgi:hypothetical protein